MEPARCTVSATLLMPQDRVARPAVPVWAVRLRERLARTRAGERHAWRHAETVGGLANNAALIAAFQGAADTAGALCRGQIRWQDRLARRAGQPQISQLGVQPWVNLGRLEAMAGDWAAALERFARLRHPGADGRLCLGSMRIAADGDSRDDGGTSFDGFLRNVYVGDSLKALLSNRRWEEVLAFADGLDGDARTSARVDEARIVAWCRLGEAERAIEAAERGARHAGGWVRAVFALRRAEALGVAGRTDEAAELLASMAGVMARLSPGACARLENLYVVHRVAQACGEVGLREDSAALGGAAARAAVEAEDEVLRIEALRVACAAGVEEAVETLAALEGSTGYARYRRGARAPLRDDAADLLFAELHAVFAE
jgi:hypothetical protein